MDAIQSAGAALPARQAAPQGGSQSGVISSDFNTFLKMLTAQIRNQDPLDPMESTDFAVQLATFSGVEQQVQTNELLQGLFIQMGQMGLAQLTGWVGMEARVNAPVSFDGAPVTLYPNTQASADRTELVAYDAAGNEVSRQVFDSSTGPLVWAGTDSAGNPLPSGSYVFETENFVDGELTARGSVESYQRIEEARFADGQTVLVLPGGIETYAANVLSLREGA